MWKIAIINFQRANSPKIQFTKVEIREEQSNVKFKKLKAEIVWFFSYKSVFCLFCFISEPTVVCWHDGGGKWHEKSLQVYFWPWKFITRIQEKLLNVDSHHFTTQSRLKLISIFIIGVIRKWSLLNDFIHKIGKTKLPDMSGSLVPKNIQVDITED